MSSVFRRAWAQGRAGNLLQRQHRAHQLPRYSTKGPPPSEVVGAASRIERIESRIPKFLRRYITPLRTAPVSHITAFLILHELTAIVPLFGLAGLFHYTNWLPPLVGEGKWVSQGVEKFGGWMRKRGWITEENRKGIWWGRGETGTKIVVELATAYAVTKALLPLRLALSVWGTPWFAKWTTLPLKSGLSRLFRRKPAIPTKTSGAAGTGATGAGTVTKDVP